MDADLDRAALALVEAALDADRPEDHVRDHAPDARVRDRALALLARQDSDALQTGGLTCLGLPAKLPDRIGAYRITGLIGQGGMGAVYRGERVTGDFEHQVAIKLVRPGALSEALTERLARERQTLARLVHPNIARLLDGGATEDGSPYIVMELVDGVPIDRWLANDPAASARTALFLAICDAVGFAHQNLVVHRDLTPANILVTPAGQPRLIDFGIARPLDAADGGATGRAAEPRSMTPGFAAPERRLPGQPATTLGDIYSLGRLLERLFPDTNDGDLSSIMARATAEDPAARYPSAGALADDVARWRDRRPVHARRGGRRYVLGRFIARNRLAVAAAAVALALLVAALASTLIANARAQAARAEAERRFAETRAIAKTLIFDVYDQLLRIPGSTAARATVVAAGLRYLDALAADPGGPRAVRLETGAGYARLAAVVGTGASGTLGKMADAGALLDRAEQILTAAYREDPADPAGRRALAALLVERAQVSLYNDNDVPRARRAARLALALVGPAAGDAEAARIRLAALSAQGEALSWDAAWIPARERYLAAERFVAGLPPAMRDGPAVTRTRAMNQKLLAEAEHGLQDEAAARAAIDRAVTMQERLLARDPTDPAKRRSVVAAYRYSAILHRANGDGAAARRAIARATAAARALRDANPADAGAALLWLVSAEVEAQTLSDLGRRDETVRLGEEMRREYRRLIDLAGDAAGMHRHFYAALRTIGGDYYNVGEFRRACDAWREARIHLDWLAARAEMTETDRRGRADVLRYMGEFCTGRPRRGSAARL